MRSIALWNRANLSALDYGEQHLGARYLCLRLEDLCREPVGAICRMLEFLGAKGDAKTLARQEVARPASLGRWQVLSEETLGRLESLAHDGLSRFGYTLITTHSPVQS